MNAKYLAVTGLALSIVSIMGCRVSSDKQGDNENVTVATPFGGLKVKASDTKGVEGIGLPVYPGSELVKKKDKDNASADVNLSFGKFQLRVKATSYRTQDDTDKVTAYYHDALKKYGVVITCQHDRPVGIPTRTDEGLTCSDSDNKQASTKIDATSNEKLELKAGSKQHQHIVGIEQEGSGTKYGLVALDLPTSMTGDGDNDARQ